jgi:hypothetical protein
LTRPKAKPLPPFLSQTLTNTIPIQHHPAPFSSQNTLEENEESEENEENPIPQKAKNFSLFHLEKQKSLTFVAI